MLISVWAATSCCHFASSSSLFLLERTLIGPCSFGWRTIVVDWSLTWSVWLHTINEAGPTVLKGYVIVLKGRIWHKIKSYNWTISTFVNTDTLASCKMVTGTISTDINNVTGAKLSHKFWNWTSIMVLKGFKIRWHPRLKTVGWLVFSPKTLLLMYRTKFLTGALNVFKTGVALLNIILQVKPLKLKNGSFK